MEEDIGLNFKLDFGEEEKNITNLDFKLDLGEEAKITNEKQTKNELDNLIGDLIQKSNGLNELQKNSKVKDTSEVKSIDTLKFANIISKKDLQLQYNEYCNNIGEGLKATEFSDISDKLDGIVPGLYLLGAEPNMGKSAYMIELLRDLTYTNPDTFGLYISLDDSKYDIIPRIIASMASIEIKYAAKPKILEKLIEDNGEQVSFALKTKEQRDKFLNYYFSEENNLVVLDESDVGNSIDNISEYIIEFSNFLKETLNKKLIVCLDSIKDITISGISNSNELNEQVAKRVKTISKEASCPIFSSIHLKKIEGNRRPMIMDLKDSIVYQYEANVVWLLYNDVSKNNRLAKIFLEDGISTEKKPVLELNWAKNKCSSYKGHSFFKFAPEKSMIKAITNSDLLKSFEEKVYT